MAQTRRHFLENFSLLGRRAVAKAANEGPAAWVFDASQKRQGLLRDLMSLLRLQGVEVQVADEPFTIKPDWPPPAPAEPSKAAESAGAAAQKSDKTPPKKDDAVTFAKGSYIIRMNQPYSPLADAMLDIQYVRGSEQVYDDTGWTLGYLKNLDFKRIANPEVLKVPMRAWTAPAPTTPRVVANVADTDFARLAFAAKQDRISEEETTIDGTKVPAR